jgi:hypothetical protein
MMGCEGLTLFHDGLNLQKKEEAEKVSKCHLSKLQSKLFNLRTVKVEEERERVEFVCKRASESGGGNLNLISSVMGDASKFLIFQVPSPQSSSPSSFFC